MAAPPFQALPPGVYFNPSAEECVRDFLRPWIAGVRPWTDRIIVDVDVYSDSPAVLVRGREPGFSRGFEHKWLMLTHCIRLSGGGRPRVKRDVATGGNWRVEQRSKGVAERAEDEEDPPPGGDRRRTNGFYLGGGRGKGKDGGVKTSWLMEELTNEEEEVGGWRGERTVKVFCKLYVSPRASKDEKLEIFGDDRVPFDRHGNAKTLVAPLPEDLFDALAETVYEAEGQGPPPPPPARRVLGHQQGQPAAAPPQGPRVLGLQQGQPAARPPLPVQYGQAVMPWGVPAHHHGHGGPRPAFLGYQRGGQAAPPQVQGVAVQPQRRHVLDPYHHFQEASPGVAGYYNHQDTVVYYYPAPPFVRRDPLQGEEMTHMEKKPRLAYGSPPAQPQGGGDSDMSSCVVQASTSQEKCGDTDADAKVVQEAEPVPTPSPPQEIPGTATAPLELADDAFKAAAEPMRECDIFIDLTDLPFLLDDVPDFLMPQGTCKLPSADDEPPPQPGFDEFALDDLIEPLRTSPTS